MSLALDVRAGRRSRWRAPAVPASAIVARGLVEKTVELRSERAAFGAPIATALAVGDQFGPSPLEPLGLRGTPRLMLLAKRSALGVELGRSALDTGLVDLVDISRRLRCDVPGRDVSIRATPRHRAIVARVRFPEFPFRHRPCPRQTHKIP